MTPVGASFSQVPGEHEGPTQQLALAPIPMERRSMKKSILYFIAVATLFMCSGCSQEGASASSVPSWKDGLEVVRQDTVVVANLNMASWFVREPIVSTKRTGAITRISKFAQRMEITKGISRMLLDLRPLRGPYRLGSRVST